MMILTMGNWSDAATSLLGGSYVCDVAENNMDKSSFPAGETSTLVGGEYTYNIYIYTHIVIPNIYIYIENVYKIVVT